MRWLEPIKGTSKRSSDLDIDQHAVTLNKGKSIFIELESPNFKVDWQKVEHRISSKTRMIIINNPHNPCFFKTLNNIVKVHGLNDMR